MLIQAMDYYSFMANGTKFGRLDSGGAKKGENFGKQR